MTLEAGLSRSPAKGQAQKGSAQGDLLRASPTRAVCRRRLLLPSRSCSHFPFGPETSPDPVPYLPRRPPAAPGVSRPAQAPGPRSNYHRRSPPPFLRRLKRGGRSAEHVLPHRGTAAASEPSRRFFLASCFFPPSEFGVALLCILPRRCCSCRLSRRAAPARLRLLQAVQPAGCGSGPSRAQHDCHLLRVVPGAPAAAAALHQPLGRDP